MIIRIKDVTPLDNYVLLVSFDDGRVVYYDMNEDIETMPDYCDLKNIYGLWQQVQIDTSRTYIYWNDYIDLASDTLYEYGTDVNSNSRG